MTGFESRKRRQTHDKLCAHIFFFVFLVVMASTPGMELDLNCKVQRRCRATSYITMAAATETFNDGTLPSMGMETRKSHFLRTCSCNPRPSAPSTSAQSI